MEEAGEAEAVVEAVAAVEVEAVEVEAEAVVAVEEAEEVAKNSMISMSLKQLCFS